MLKLKLEVLKWHHFPIKFPLIILGTECHHGRSESKATSNLRSLTKRSDKTRMGSIHPTPLDVSTAPTYSVQHLISCTHCAPNNSMEILFFHFNRIDKCRLKTDISSVKAKVHTSIKSAALLFKVLRFQWCSQLCGKHCTISNVFEVQKIVSIECRVNYMARRMWECVHVDACVCFGYC